MAALNSRWLPMIMGLQMSASRSLKLTNIGTVYRALYSRSLRCKAQFWYD
jgi:hypothetical protein